MILDKTFLLSTRLPPSCYAVEQSCTLIRLGSAGANHPSLSSPLLFCTPLVTLFFSPTLPVLRAPLWLPEMSLSWGYIYFQQLYSLLFTGKPAGWGPHNNKALILHLSPYQLKADWRLVCNLPSPRKKETSKEVNDLWRADRGAGPSCRVK